MKFNKLLFFLICVFINSCCAVFPYHQQIKNKACFEGTDSYRFQNPLI